MTDLINFDNEAGVIDFGTADNTVSDIKRDRELQLQERAGVEPSEDFEGVRAGLASNIEQTQLEELYEVSSNSLQSGANADAVSKYIQQFNPTVSAQDLDISLEVAAAATQAEESFIDNENTAINNAVDISNIEEDLAKDELFTTYISELRDYAKSGNVVTKFGELVESLVEPQITQNMFVQSLFPGGKKNGVALTQETYAEAVREYFAENASKMSVKEFKQFLDASYAHIVSKSPNTWMLAEALDAIEAGGNRWIDYFGWAEGVGWGADAVTTAAKAAKRAGNINKLGKLAKESHVSGNTADMAKEYITPTITKPVQTIEEVSSSSRVAPDLADSVSIQEAQRVVDEAGIVGIRDEAELEIIAKQARDKAGEVFDKRAVDPVDAYAVELPDGSLQTNVLLGNSRGNAMTAKIATQKAEALGLAEDQWRLVKKDGEGYFIETSETVVKPNTGTADATQWNIQFSHKPLQFLEGPINFVNKHFGGVIKIGKEAHARAVEADRAQQALVGKFIKDYQRSMTKLDKEGRQALENLYLEGQHLNEGFGKWFTKEELDAKEIAEDVQKAYFDYQKMSDIEYVAKDADYIRKLTRAGFQSFNDGIIGRKKPIKGFVYDAKKLVRDLDGNIIDDLTAYGDNTHTLVEVAVNRIGVDDFDMTHVLIPNSALKESPLPRYSTHYLPGGRRSYMQGENYVKIGTTYINSRTGTVLNGFPKTLTTGDDIRTLQKYADEVNKIADIAKRGIKSPTAIMKEIEKAELKFFNIDNYDAYKKLIKTSDNPKGIIDPAHKAKVVGSGQKYNYDNAFESLEDNLGDIDTALQDLINTRAQFSRHRGNILDDVNGHQARLVDLPEMYNRTIRKAAYTLSKGELLQWYNKELEKFSGVISNWNSIRNLPAMDRLYKAEVPQGALRGRMPLEDRRMVRAAERFLQHAGRILGAKTKADEFFDRAMYGVAKAVNSLTPKQLRNRKVFEKIANSKPQSAAKGVVFWSAMGAYNFSQLIKQGLGVMNTLAAKPIHGTQAMLAYPFIRLIRGSDSFPKMKQVLSKAVQAELGLTTTEFNKLMKYFDDLGVKYSSGLEIGARAEFGEALARDKNILEKVWDSQYWPMREGNALNYYVADIAAFLEKKDKSFREIAQYSDDLFMNMTRSNASSFQAGQNIPLTDLAAQWMSYPVRMIEMLGGRLSIGQKARIVLANTVLFGTAGTFLSDEQELHTYQWMVDEGVSPETVDKILSGGIRYLAKEAGINFDEGVRVGEQVEGIFKLINLADGEVNVPDFAGKKAVPEILATIGAIKEFIAPECGDVDYYRWLKYVAVTKDLPTGIRNIAKGVVGLVEGKFYDTHGRIIKKDVNASQAIAQMLGFGPVENRQLTDEYIALLDKDEAVAEAIKTVEPYIQAIRLYESRTPEDQEHLQNIYNNRDVVLKGLRRDLRELYPDGDAVRLFDSQVAKMTTGEYKYVTEERTRKAVEGLGYNQTQIILRKKEEILNGSVR